jgi:hypothetical protein
MVIQFILVGLYIIFLDPTPQDMTWIKALVVIYLIISYFFIKPNKLNEQWIKNTIRKNKK